MVPGRLRFLIAAWALSCLGPRVLPAQDAPYRPALNQLRGALDSAPTLADVDLVAARWNATSRNPAGRLGDAYIELRRGMLTNNRLALISAWDGFDQVVRIHPDWPYARLGLAVAALEIYSRRYPLPASYDDVAGGTHYDGYAIQMKRMLRSEPTFQPAINWLAGTMSADGDREQPGAILEALQFIADSTNSTDPRVQLVLARAERLQGDAAQSVPRIDAYVREGGDSGIGDLEMARSLAWMGSLENAAVEYMAGARVQTDEARVNYRLDISWVATPRELERFDSLPADSVGAFIGHFWSKRDVQELRSDGSRLQEHLRRWVYVSQNFRVPDPGRRTAYREVFIPYGGTPCQQSAQNSLDDYDYTEPARQGGYRAPERVFNHRAIVYMRHGEPLSQLGGDYAAPRYGASNRGNPALSNRYDPGFLRSESNILTTATSAPGPATAYRALPPATPARIAFERSVTWVYLIGGQLRVFTFVGHQALGSNTASTLIVNVPPNLGVLQQLASLSASYARLAGEAERSAFGGSVIPLPCQRSYLEVVGRQREDAAVAVKTDTYLRRFAHPLPAAIQFSAMGQPTQGTGELLAVLAVRASELAGEAVPGDTDAVRFVLRLRVAAIDSLTGESVRMDTVRQFLSTTEMVQRDAWLSFITKLPLRPGLREVRLSVEQDDDRGSVFGAAIDPAAAGFSASDIVLGNDHGSVPWRRNDVTVKVSPFSAYVAGESVPIYYELYGLSSGGEYRTTLSLRRSGNTKVASSLSFTDKASTATLTSNRALTLNEVKPGLYDMILTVEEVATGRRVVRQRVISVDARQAGS